VVTVTLRLAGDGGLLSLRASGHAAGTAPGASVPCAAVSVLLRTAARVLWAAGAVGAGGADEPGLMELVVSPERRVPPDWLRGVTDSLLTGLRDLEAEFPREVALRIL
jgi:uncharacterized protein YsxB (DUF464 family)